MKLQLNGNREEILSEAKNAEGANLEIGKSR